MRLVLDTNVLIAAFVARGQCHELLEHAARAHELFVSPHILEEFRGKLLGKFRVPADAAEEAVNLLLARLQLVEPEALPEPVCRDRDDDAVLATALAARADYLITGDGDLLMLGALQTVQIIRPAGFWEIEAGKERSTTSSTTS